ncbi:MAG TPA: cupredoxin family copper-binding protein [Ramlibacter sp.]|uniref:cupredoxin domain-containing protein n=1 Tax=Ramlibacter sp. TaxID=1917967 RepID=UPI002D809A52|nr:cupredoxin family copper-binding protein [Ramlibacter sp.]HET8745341.1 cupredoxin family copper-binding protein [Ramlibacter sp.]
MNPGARKLLLAAGLAAACALPGLAAAATHTVVIEGMKSVPETLTVNKGDTVVWQNKDVVPHTVTAKGNFDSGDLAVGKSWRHVMTKAGTYDYFCNYHPGMKATVVVK